MPFQNNTTFDYGPRHGTQNILNIQPVLPFTLTEDWNLITRWILPIVHQPSFAKGDSSDTGTGNLNPTLFLSTSLAEDFLVGFGPTFLLPTASSDELGTKKWGAGPSAVVVWRCRWSGCGDIGTDERRYRRLAAGWRIGELSSVIDGKGGVRRRQAAAARIRA